MQNLAKIHQKTTESEYFLIEVPVLQFFYKKPIAGAFQWILENIFKTVILRNTSKQVLLE